MAIKLCHHIRENGVLCNAAALRGRDYCYSHLTFRGRRVRAAQQRARSTAWRLELPLLEDLNAVQISVMQVVDALIDDRIDRHRAGSSFTACSKPPTICAARNNAPASR